VAQAPGCGLDRALVAPLVQSTTFVQHELGDGSCQHAYSRVSNPTVDHLESALGLLEDAPPAVCFSSGLAAESGLFTALLGAGDHVVVGQAIYGGTVRLLREIFARFGVSHTFVDSSDPLQVARAIGRSTRLIFLESPANPTMLLSDIQEISWIGRGAGVPVAVDNTFLTPVLQQPLELGADISVYSTTKFIDGHSLALGGAIVTRDTDLLDRLRFVRKSCGTIQTPYNAWLTSRGIKTLPLRLQRHSENALRVARWLKAQPCVTVVNYPGLDDFPQRDLAERLHRGGHGGVLSFELEGGLSAATEFLRHLQLFSLVEHVGSVESLVTHPVTMTHADVPDEQRLASGITPGLFRLSIGLEDAADLIDDLARAMEAVWGAGPDDNPHRVLQALATVPP
jgi:cystathionine beta-lyase/cystathionine gamma-synthase